MFPYVKIPAGINAGNLAANMFAFKASCQKAFKRIACHWIPSAVLLSVGKLSPLQNWVHIVLIIGNSLWTLLSHRSKTCNRYLSAHAHADEHGRWANCGVSRDTLYVHTKTNFTDVHREKCWPDQIISLNSSKEFNACVSVSLCRDRIIGNICLPFSYLVLRTALSE